jgi:transposase
MRNVAIRMKAQGMTYRAIAGRLGVVVSAVYRAVNKPERRAA